MERERAVDSRHIGPSAVICDDETIHCVQPMEQGKKGHVTTTAGVVTGAAWKMTGPLDTCFCVNGCKTFSFLSGCIGLLTVLYSKGYTA